MQNEKYVVAKSKKEIEAMIKQQKAYRKRLGKRAAIHGVFVAVNITANVLLSLNNNSARLVFAFLTGVNIYFSISSLRKRNKLGEILKDSERRLNMKRLEIALTGKDSDELGDEIFGEKIPQRNDDDVTYI